MLNRKELQANLYQRGLFLKQYSQSQKTLQVQCLCGHQFTVYTHQLHKLICSKCLQQKRQLQKDQRALRAKLSAKFNR